MKLTTKKIFMLSIVLLFIFVAAACGGNDNSSSESTDSGSTNTGTQTETEPELEPVHIDYWTDPRFTNIKGLEDQTQNPDDWERILAEEFMEMHPHVTIEVQALTWDDLGTRVPVSIAGGSPPDLLRDYVGRTAGYAHEGVLEDLNGLIPQSELDDYIPDYIDMYTINGELHALPLFTWASAMVLNRQIWEDNGLDHLLPAEGELTWSSFEQYEEATKALADVDAYPAGVQVATSQGDNGILAWFWSHGAKLYKDGDHSKTALNSPEAVNALNRLVEYHEDGLLQPSAVSSAPGEMNSYFQNEAKLAAWWGNTTGLWPLLESTVAAGDAPEGKHKLQKIKQPDIAGVQSGLYVGPTSLAVFKQDDDYKREWVIEFALFMSSAEQQRDYAINGGQFPARISAQIPDAELTEEARITQELLADYGAEDVGITSAHFGEIRELLAPMVQSVLLGQKTPEEALADYERDANAVLSR